jgi:hypothetical protein
MADAMGVSRFVTEKHRTGDSQRDRAHIGVNIASAWFPLPDHFLRELDREVVITGDRFLMKRWQDQPALLLVLRTIHSREAKTYPALRRIVRAVNELTGGSKPRWIAKNLAIEFGSKSEDVQLRWFAKPNRSDGDQVSVLSLQLAHAPDRITEKVNVFARRTRTGKDIFLHQRRDLN